jgi:hypothetical protein
MSFFTDLKSELNNYKQKVVALEKYLKNIDENINEYEENNEEYKNFFEEYNIKNNNIFLVTLL